MKRLFVVLAACAVLAIPAAARQSGLTFLRIGPDAAHLATGDAGAAVVEGPFAAERNPAGLALGAGTRVALTHHVWIAGVRTYGGAARFRLGRGGVGVYARAVSSGEIDVRTGPGPSDGTFEAQFTGVGAAVAQVFGPLRLGAGVKLLSERIFAVSATGSAFDAGAQLDIAGGAVRLAGVYQHAGSMKRLAQRSTRLPRTVRGGVAVHPFRVIALDDGARLVDSYVTVEVSRDLADASTQWHIGASVDVMETLRVRGGYVTDDDLRGVSAGVGLLAGPFEVDYALLPFSAGFDGPGHVFTLSYALRAP